MKSLVIFITLLSSLDAFSADGTVSFRPENSSLFSISSGLVYENLGSQNFMVQVGAGYRTRPQSLVGIAAGVSPVVEGDQTSDTFLQVFWENKKWIYSISYNWLEISKFASVGTTYNFDLYRNRNLKIRSGLGIDMVAQQLPADFVIRTGLFSFAPKLGVNVVFDL